MNRSDKIYYSALSEDCFLKIPEADRAEKFPANVT